MRETLQQLGTRFDSSKLSGHSYAAAYEEMLGPLRDEPITLLEIGLDGCPLDLPYKGGSMRMWLEYFPNASIIGIDAGPFTRFTHPRMRTIVCDQSDPRMATLFPANSLDVVIDDAGHVPQAQRASQHYLWEALKPGGLYWVEDMNPWLAAKGEDILKPWSLLPGFRVWANFKDASGAYRDDDVLVMVRKPT